MKPFRPIHLLFVLLLAVNLPGPCRAWITEPDQSCTWGIKNSDLSIPAGCVPVGAVLAIRHLRADPAYSQPSLCVTLLQSPAEGILTFAENSSGDPFEGHGACLGRYTDLAAMEGEDLVIDLAQIDDPQSWVWPLYGRPFTQTLGNQGTVAYSSALLELLDYSGTGRSFGFGFCPQGIAFSGLSLYVTVQSMTAASGPQILTYSYGNLHAPQLEAIPNYSVTCGQTLAFSIEAIDEDGDSPLAYWADNLPEGASFAGQTFTWTPAQTQAGIWPVVLGVSDGTLTDSQTVTITVAGLNHPPVLSAIDPITITENQPLSLALSASDADQDPLTFSLISGPGWLSVTAEGVLWGTPTGSDTGTATVTVQVDDGRGGTDTAAAAITVSPAAVSWTRILYDDFESGFGNWIDGGTHCLRSTKSAYAHQGTASLNLQDNTNTSVATTANLALAGRREIKVEFWYLCISMDKNTEDFWLQISTNGGQTYTTVEEWNRNDEFVNGKFYQESVILSGYTLTNQTRIRFRCDASGKDDDVYLDEIAVWIR